MSSRCVLRILVALAIVLLGAMPSIGLEAVPTAGAVPEAPVSAQVGLTQEPEGVGRVSFVHAAPFAETITDTVVSISVDGAVQPGTLSYGDISPYMGMEAGTYEIGIIPTGAMAPVLTATVTITDDQDYTLAVTGDDGNQPLELVQVEDNWTVPGPGLAALRLAHLAPFAADLADTQVDVRTDAGVLVGMLDDVEYGTFGDYLELPAGIINLVLTDPDDPATVLLDIPPIVLKAGDVMTFYAIGGANTWPLEPLPNLQFPQDPARVRVAHLAPFAAAVEDTSVSVFLNGTEVVSGFTFSATTDYVDVAPGMYTVAIVPTGEVTPAITGTVTLISGVDYTAAAVGNATLQDLDLLVTMDNNMAPTPGTARLRVVHAAPFAADDALTEVDVRDAEGEVFGGLASVAYGAVSDYLELAPATYDLTVTNPGGDTELLDIPPVTLAAGDVATLYVVGDAVNQPLDTLFVLGQMRTPTALRIAHLAPFAADSEDTAVTVAVDGSEVVSGFTFSQTTPFVDLFAGVYQVSVTPEGAVDPVLGGAMFITWDGRYTAAAIGDGVNWPLDLFVLRDDAEPADEMAALRIVHVAPFTSTLDATAVNVVAANGEPFTDVEDLTYKGVTEFSDVSPGIYDLDVTDADGAVLLDIAPFRLDAGDSATVFIVGDITNQPLGAVVTEAQIVTVIYLPMVFRNGELPQ